MGVALFERDLEIRTGITFLKTGPERVLLIDGPAGIGKTTIWRTLLDAARDDGYQVLASTANSAEVRLTFVGLADLLGPVADDALTHLPAPQARALEVALLRAHADEPSEPYAVAAGVLSALRGLAARQPVLIAIDDIQWLDGASADAITFAARRLSDESVRFMLTRRPRKPTQLERALGADLRRLTVGPLNLDSMRRMLADRLCLALPRHVLGQIFDATLGNPLFALEFGRTIADQGSPALGDELPIPETVEELVGARITGLPQPLHALLLALALGGDLETSELSAIVAPGTLDDAIDRGLVVADGQRVRPSHPLLAAMVKKRSKARERHDLHLMLASSAADEGVRAHHLALASRQPDEQLAQTVAAAATHAFARGARREAARLGEHAVRLTPIASPERPERLLTLVAYLKTVGDGDRIVQLLTDNLDSLPRGSPRARALFHLVEDVACETMDEYRQKLERVREEAKADDPALYARIVALLSGAVLSVEQIHNAEARVLEVLPTAENAAPDVERDVLYALAWARALRGRAIDDVCDRWDAVSPSPGHLANSPDRIAGQRLVWRGEISKARHAFQRILTTSDQRGEIESYIWARLHICELALRVGDWQQAGRLLLEWEETAEREFFIQHYHTRCRALLAAGKGLADEAISLSADTIKQAEVVGAQWEWLEGLRARGMTCLLMGDPTRAAESLSLVWDHTTREGVDEPGVFPVAPDLVEALVELGELPKALAVTSRLRLLAEKQEHPWGLVTAQRCAGLTRLAGPKDNTAPIHGEDSAAAELQAAADGYQKLGLHFDRGRTLLALGKAERRLRKWGAARRSLELAAGTFDQIGSTGWAARTRSEMDRIGARRPGGAGELTATERRVVELAANGRSNKEIAQALFVTINTVEGHLSHAYAKLGVRSRAQLAHQLTRDGLPGVTG
jgi:DNA-binding CsgD family transcriptional regulator